MHFYFFLYFVLLNLLCGEALFFWKDKPIFFCFKVCPLYCSRNSNRRYDEDTSSLVHNIKRRSNFESEFWVEEFPDFHRPYYYGHWLHNTTEKPKTTTMPPTTTQAPTTTPEQTYICVVCEKKCGYRGMMI